MTLIGSGCGIAFKLFAAVGNPVAMSPLIAFTILAADLRPIPLDGMSLDRAHRVVRLTLVLTDFVDRNDVRVVKSGNRLDFFAEPPYLGRAGELL